MVAGIVPKEGCVNVGDQWVTLLLLIVCFAMKHSLGLGTGQ